jgi:hypothetical protein
MLGKIRHYCEMDAPHGNSAAQFLGSEWAIDEDPANGALIPHQEFILFRYLTSKSEQITCLMWFQRQLTVISL